MTEIIRRSLWHSERTERLLQNELSCTYGIPYLDDSLSKILPTDMTIIGATTGAGKTELATNIASHNARDGKRVFFIALEAAKGEIHRRIKWPYVLNWCLHNKSRFPLGTFFNFRDWILGEYDAVTAVFEEKLADELEETFRNLDIYYPTVSEFLRDDLRCLWEDGIDSRDLIIVDHLHYLDHEETQETLGVKRNVSTIRDLVNKHKIPCILICHLRKPDRFANGVTPRIWELHGSSEISKQCTNAVSFASTTTVGDQEYTKVMTAVEVLKARWAAGTGYLGVCEFNWQSKTYGPTYDLFRVKDRLCQNVDPVNFADKPFWAKRMFRENL